MAKATKTLVWNKVDISKLPKELQPLWAARVKAAQALRKASEDFEKPFKAMLTNKKLAVEDGENVIRVGYNFGGLSFAQDKKADGAQTGGIDLTA